MLCTRPGEDEEAVPCLPCRRQRGDEQPLVLSATKSSTNFSPFQANPHYAPRAGGPALFNPRATRAVLLSDHRGRFATTYSQMSLCVYVSG